MKKAVLVFLKVVLFIIFPILGALNGIIFYNQIKSMIHPPGTWEMIFYKNYGAYYLNSMPESVLYGDPVKLYLITNYNETLYSCVLETKKCSKINGSEVPIPLYLDLITHDVSTTEVPTFQGGNIHDIVKILIPQSIAPRYEYYMVANDGSVWHWGHYVSIEDSINYYVGVILIGSLGFIIGLVLGGIIAVNLRT